MTDFPNNAFQKQDFTDDSHFYSVPRKVVHIDASAIAAVTALARELLPPGGAILDLMSSWRSHLPDDVSYARVVGLGMNAAEMADNPQLDAYTVQNLNRQPALPYDDAAFDGALCTVSVQYLQQPVAVFREAARVLKPGAPFLVTFSNRCFPSKAVAIWLQNGDAGHIALVERYFVASGAWAGLQTRTKAAKRSLFGGEDPLFAVWAYASSNAE
ncbi:MAG: class I SAM-dependent methyltransferase [Anaerolineales bacterium]